MPCVGTGRRVAAIARADALCQECCCLQLRVHPQRCEAPCFLLLLFFLFFSLARTPHLAVGVVAVPVLVFTCNALPAFHAFARIRV